MKLPATNFAARGKRHAADRERGAAVADLMRSRQLAEIQLIAVATPVAAK